VFLAQAGTLVEAVLSGQITQAAADLTIAVTAGIAGAIQKGYVWTDAPPEGEQ
jgi:predicted RNA-binding protein associated with RNAse of E/G family